MQSKSIWKQTEVETDLEYKYFSAYHIFGDTRTVGKVAREFGVSSRHLYNISKKHNWKKRVEASDLYHYQYEIRLLQKELKSDRKLRFITAKNLYRRLQYKMKNFSEYIDCYVPDKAKNLSLNANRDSDDHVDRFFRVLKMIHLYELITTRFDNYFDKEIETSLNPEVSLELDEQMLMLEEEVNLFDESISEFTEEVGLLSIPC